MYTDSNARLGLLMSDGTYRYYGRASAPLLGITWFYGDGQWDFDNLMALPLFWSRDSQGRVVLTLDEINFFDQGNIQPFNISYSVSYDEVAGTWTLDIFGQTFEGIVEGDETVMLDVPSVYFVR